MKKISISLPDPLSQFVSSRATKEGFENEEEYVRSLLSKEQERLRKLEELRKDLQIGIEQLRQGQCRDMDMQAIKKEARRRMETDKAGA